MSRTSALLGSRKSSINTSFSKYIVAYPMMMKQNLFLLLLFCALAANAQNQKFPPVNDITDPTLLKFIDLLKTAATNKDVKFITGQLDKEVTSSFDGENTVKAFIDNWGLNQDSTKFWSYLSRALEVGGAYIHDPEDSSGRYQVVFPYVYNLRLNLEDDPYNVACIVGENVNIRDKPDAKGKVKAQLSYDVVLIQEVDDSKNIGTSKNADGDPEWYLVTTYNNKLKGWVNWKYLYSVSGPRLFLFKNATGRWRISSFVDGD